MTRERFTDHQIGLLRYLAKRGAQLRAVTLARWQRVIALPLWRRELIEIWWRQMPGHSQQGPYFGLTIVGARVAQTFIKNPAPRGSSGAEHRP